MFLSPFQTRKCLSYTTFYPVFNTGFLCSVNFSVSKGTLAHNAVPKTFRQNVSRTIIISSHRMISPQYKKEASKSLTGWQYAELTAEQWIEKLTLGQTIQPSAFTPKPDGEFTHSIENWVNTHFVYADADYIRGVEFLDDGSDKNPDGVEPWTEEGYLSLKFPSLLYKVYAVTQSVSSMSDAKSPPHRRYQTHLSL